MRKMLRLVFGLAAALAAGSPALAAFQQPLTSPESAALSNAALLGRPDSALLFTNPAGLAGLRAVDSYFTYTQLYAGMQGTGSMGYGFMTLGVPTKVGTLGFGVGTLQAVGLLNERTLSLGYAHSIGPVDLGVAAKSLYHSYDAASDPASATNPVFANGTSRSAFSFDAGAIYHATPALDFGLAVRDLNQPNVGLSSVDQVPRSYQASAAYEWKSYGLRLTADAVYSDPGWGTLEDKLTPGLGLEKWVADRRVAFRFGVTSLGASAGIGLRLGNLEFDYALLMQLNTLQGNYGTNTLGVRIRFGAGKGGAQ